MDNVSISRFRGSQLSHASTAIRVIGRSDWLDQASLTGEEVVKIYSNDVDYRLICCACNSILRVNPTRQLGMSLLDEEPEDLKNLKLSLMCQSFFSREKTTGLYREHRAGSYWRYTVEVFVWGDEVVTILKDIEEWQRVYWRRRS